MFHVDCRICCCDLGNIAKQLLVFTKT